MSSMDLESLSDLSMLELFRMEVETQAATMTDGLLALERDADPAPRVRELMRAAHSLKGAARIVGRNVAVRISHAMEDCLVAVQTRKRPLSQELIDTLLQAVDLLGSISQVSEEAIESWEGQQSQRIEALLLSLSSAVQSPRPPAAPVRERAERPEVSRPHAAPTDRVLRVTSENLDHLMALAGEALVASRWLSAFATDTLGLKQLQHLLGQTLEGLRNLLLESTPKERTQGQLLEARNRLAACKASLAERLAAIDLFDSRFLSFSGRLYHEVLDCRMRPFADGVQGFPRMVRDVANSLGKQVKLDIIGETTQVDRDILGKLDAPLGHLLRNAVDHGLEPPDERRAAGKPAEGVLRLEVRHSAGALHLIISDDGRGVDLDRLRRAVVERHLVDLQAGAALSEAELLPFLFLPGFSMKSAVTEISGR